MKFTASTLFAACAAAAPFVEKRQAGQIFSGCTTPGVVAMTFDDGPFAYTDQALNTLNAAGMKGTFFVNGANWGSIWDYSSTMQRIVNEGHMFGSHTWSHADLGASDASTVTSQMTQLEDATLSIVGRRPLTVRLPYLSSNGQTLSTLGGLGYSVIGVTIDTKDYMYTSSPQTAVDNFVAGLNAGGTIALVHDVHPSTVNSVLPGMISALQARGLRGVTIQECLGFSDSQVYAYSARGSTTPTNPTNPNPTNPGELPISQDWQCGPGAGTRCPAGNCCSMYNWCGTGSDYCGSGCQSGFGSC